ncbi:DUF2267 domain-containing protein [Halobacterium sp. KA-6]|uniref:DUF2267 domain-containing protein n=1 Tax=Halobacterium sp. KA-6 TaxID=2896368 RepID=UPI001E5C7CDF|nr:DUF2267 domain-containing protein [Halobacterium sp. KA-6]
MTSAVGFNLSPLGGPHMVTEGFYSLARTNDAFDTDAEVDATVDAVAETLGESLSRGETVDLAEHLPEDVSETLLDASADAEEPESPPLDEFYDRVAERADLDRATTPQKAQAVGVAIAESVGDELGNARAQLPPAYEELFEPPAVRREPFAETVRRRLDLDSDQEAQEASEAVLGALGERLPKGETEDLAVYLPADVEDAIVVDDPAEATDYSRSEFVLRVGERADVDNPTAHEYANVVLGRLAEVADDEELDRALEQLPVAYESFFERA